MQISTALAIQGPRETYKRHYIMPFNPKFHVLLALSNNHSHRFSPPTSPSAMLANSCPLQTTPCPTYVHKAHSGCCMNVDIVLVVILWWGHFLYRFGGPEQFRHVRPQSSVKDNISKVKSEIQGVVNVMQNNISKVLDRGAKLEDLQDKSGMNGGDHYELAVCVNTTHSNLDHSWCLPFLL